MFLVSKMHKGTSTSVSGIYQTGEFGFESDIYSTNRKAISHRRQTDEADMLPFNFSFYLPKDTTTAQRKRGLLLLGRFNQHGIRQLTIPHLQVSFKNTFQDLSLSIERVVPRVVMETLLERGSLKTIRLVKKQLPRDLADIFSDSDKDKVADFEIVIKSKRRSSFSDIDWLMRAVENRQHPSQIITMPAMQPDNIKLEIIVDGRSRVVDLGNPGKLSSNIELDSISPDRNGHPKTADWLKEADQLASSIVNSWGVRNMTWSSSV
jgi:hypothetical protein